MIRMESPSFAFNSVDVPGPDYRMWQTFSGALGFTAAELSNKINEVNRVAWEREGTQLRNIIINCHGADGGLAIGGKGQRHLDLTNLGVFFWMKGKNLGTIWLVACQAANGGESKQFCRTLAMTTGCQVVASDEDQDTGVWGSIRLVTSLNNIDEFEGTVFGFTANGGLRVINPHDDIYTILE